MARAHILRPILDEDGHLLVGATVTINEADLSVPINQPIYTGPSDDTTLPNPFTAADGLVNLWLERPQRVNAVIEFTGLNPISTYLDALPPADEVVRSAAPIRILNTPAQGDVLKGGATPGDAEWKSFDLNEGHWHENTEDARVGGANGTVGFYGATGTSRPVIEQNADGNASVAALLQALHNLGVIEWTGTP